MYTDEFPDSWLDNCRVFLDSIETDRGFVATLNTEITLNDQLRAELNLVLDPNGETTIISENIEKVIICSLRIEEGLEEIDKIFISDATRARKIAIKKELRVPTRAGITQMLADQTTSCFSTQIKNECGEIERIPNYLRPLLAIRDLLDELIPSTTHNFKARDYALQARKFISNVIAQSNGTQLVIIDAHGRRSPVEIGNDIEMLDDEYATFTQSQFETLLDSTKLLESAPGNYILASSLIQQFDNPETAAIFCSFCNDQNDILKMPLTLT